MPMPKVGAPPKDPIATGGRRNEDAAPADGRTALGLTIPPFLIAKVVTLAAPAFYFGLIRREAPLYWTWDTRHYTDIALNGYPSHFGDAYAFLPGYPALLRAAMVLVPNPTNAGILLSLPFEFVAIYFLARLVTMERDVQSARFASWALVLWPAAIFLSVAYAESPLLAGGTASLYFVRRGRFGAAAGAAAFACAMKVLGLVLIVALLVEYWNRHRWRPRRSVLAIACVPLPLALFAAYAWLHIGDPLAYAHAQALPIFGGLHPAFPWQGFWTDVNVVIHDPTPNRLTYIGELFWAALGLGGVAWAWTRPRFPRPLAAYCAVLMALILCFSFWRSLGRYELNLFPLLIPLADVTAGRIWLRRGLLAISASGMIYGTYAFTSGGWWG
jgi:hypothetical protein